MNWSDDQHFELCAEDRELLDRLVESGFDADGLEPLNDDERARAQALVNLFGLLEDYPVEDADETLLHATLARIDRYEDEQAARMKVELQAATRRIRMPDFITVAAAILIMASVAWPLFTHIRDRSVDMACANNQRLMGFALHNYNADWDVTPVAQAGLGNVLNLAPLIENEYCERGHLSCPGHDALADSTYSVHFYLPGHSIDLEALRGIVIVGDRNPVIDAARRGTIVPPLTVSPSHRGRGQNVLSTDGSTMWLTQPVIGGDNIWLPDGVERLDAQVRPGEADDVFLTH